MSANAEFEACLQGVAEFLESFTPEEIENDPWAGEQVAILDGMLEYAMRLYVEEIGRIAHEELVPAKPKLYVPGRD